MNYSISDTIIALATPAGTGSISVIRISGEKSFNAVDTAFRGKIKISDCQTHTIHYGNIVTNNGEVIDDVLISVFRTPNSYTGENSVEISSHGSQFVVQQIISRILENNEVRPAEPGEYTKRAFLNGKIDLAQAEAVADVINARTEASLRGARNQLDGILSAKVDELRTSLVDISSLIELELDFAEEDIEFVALDQVKIKVNDTILEIDKLLKTYSFGKVIRDGVNVALVGKPNVGKSSLLNYFLKESRAIVSEIPGTTRDVIKEELSVDGILFRLFDTAGIRITEDIIEKEGVERSRVTVRNSDFVILLSDADTGEDPEFYEELKNLAGEERILRVVNKIDLRPEFHGEAKIKISAKTGEGIDNLFSALKEKAIGINTFSEKTAIVSNLRHFNALKKAKKTLISANESIEAKMSGEYISVDLRNAESSLGEIIGKVTTDDILNNIFSKFCIGK